MKKKEKKNFSLFFNVINYFRDEVLFISKKFFEIYKETVEATIGGFIFYYKENFGFSYTVGDALTMMISKTCS